MFTPPKYEELNEQEIQQECEKYVSEWNQFLVASKSLAQEQVDYFIHRKNLFEVVRRCDKRRVYMEMMNRMDSVDEYKKVAIESYWINTLKPFMVVNKELNIYSSPNEMFSLYRIMATIRRIFDKEYPNDTFSYPSEKRMQDILYDFKYCNLNREAMISFVETFADVYGVGISFILNGKESPGP